jgi:ABC-2 type transport system permease protein
MNGRAVLTITGNELLRLKRHPEVILFGLILPVIIISLIGLTFGSAGSVDLGVLDRDGTARSAALVARFEGRDGIDLQVYDDEDEMRQDVRTTAIQAGVIIPEGYEDAVLGGAAALAVVAEPTSEGVASALATIDGAAGEEGVREAAIAVVAEGSADRAEAARLVDAQAEVLAPVEVRTGATLGAEVETGSFSHTAPANLVLFVFILTFAISTILAYDRQSGVIARMMTTPTSSGTILAGIGASKLAFALLQSAVLLVVGTVAFGVEWGDPLAAAAIVVTFAIVSTAVGLLVGSTVSDQEQAQAIGIPLSVGMGMLGGCMWPLGIVPEPMQLIGHITPHAWAMDSWQEVIFDGVSLVDILPNLLVLAGIALVVGSLAVRQLRRAVTG